MIRRLLILTAGSLLLAIPSCAWDPPGLRLMSGLPEGTSVYGQVTSLDGVPVGGATVELGDRSTRTDEDGRYVLSNLEPAPERQLFVRSEDYSTGHQRLSLVADRRLEVDVRVVAAHRMELPDGAAGGRLVSPEGVALEFPAGSLTRPDGELAEGPVDVRYVLLNTAHAVPAAPGGMLAQAGDGARRPLESFGMVEVELSQGGAPLDFEGPGRLEIPLARGAALPDGAEVPLWSFDEERGLWLQEGAGLVDGERFVAEVSHYSWWNCDDWLITTHLTGGLESSEGVPLAGVTIRAEGLDYLGTSVATTDADGRFCVNVRTGSGVQLTSNGSGLVDLFYEWLTRVETPASQGLCASGQGGADIGTHQVEVGTNDADEDGIGPFGGDCADQDPSIHPGAAELCNQVDDDCDGWVDEGFPDADGDGFQACMGDCDDGDPAVWPGAPDVCDGVLDNDCDGVVDTMEMDGDGDGVTRCDGDCDDDDPLHVLACGLSTVEAGDFYTCGLETGGRARCWGWSTELAWQQSDELFAEVTSGLVRACGLTPEGEIRCFSSAGNSPWVPSDERFATFSLGVDHGCGVLQEDSTLSCWGVGQHGETDPPDGQYRELSCGHDFCCGIRQDDRLWCWGRNDLSQLQPPILEASEVDAGADHACALSLDGYAYCWGDDSDGQGLAPPVRFGAISAGERHTCGVTLDGEIRCWGSDDYGQLQAPEDQFVAVGAGMDHTCGLRPGGGVDCWGSDAFGQSSP